jgi:hypothetical protein
MGDMKDKKERGNTMTKTKQWNEGDKVTPIRGHLRGVPCVIKWSGWPVALATVVTVHGCWRSIHPNNLRSIEG